MNLRRVITLLLVGLLASMSGFDAATATQTNDDSDEYTYARCVLQSDADLAYRCATMPGIPSTFTGADGELVWPSDLPDPRLEPVYVGGSVFMCSGEPNDLVMETIDDNRHHTTLRLNSPTACSGGATEVPDEPTSLEIDAQYDPMEQATMIRFEDDLGEASFHMGECSLIPGYLTVSVPGPNGFLAIRVLYAPSVCSS